MQVPESSSSSGASPPPSCSSVPGGRSAVSCSGCPPAAAAPSGVSSCFVACAHTSSDSISSAGFQSGTCADTAAGAMFEGVWRDDGLEGDVQHTAAAGDADADGGVRRTYANGDVYRGEWEGGAPHGYHHPHPRRAAL